MNANPASFRDSAGQVYEIEGKILRSINEPYIDDWQFVINSGLLTEASEKDWLPVFHEIPPPVPEAVAGIEVEKIPFISYPYEWCFSQLKDAAKLTLDLHLAALKKDLVLKDASAYNVQFTGCSPRFIDMLSFKRRREGEPWQAYRQFCMHFLAPLVLCSYLGGWAGMLSKLRTDGIPLGQASAILPFKARFRFGVALHILVHAVMERRHTDASKAVGKINRVNISKKALIDMALSLRYLINDLTLPKKSTQWGNYYCDTNYSESAFTFKRQQVDAIAMETGSKLGLAIDLGANTGEFTSCLAPYFSTVLAPDLDPLAVELHYCALRKKGSTNVLPLVMDLSNPSPALGWACRERESFPARCKANLVIALALVHHLVLTEGIPFTQIALFLSDLLTKNGVLLLEFVPKEDSQVRRMTAVRTDSLNGYNMETMRAAFSVFFDEIRQIPVKDSIRVLLIYRKKD